MSLSMVTLEIPCGKSLLENPSVLAVLFIDLAFRLLNLAYNLLIKVQTYVSEKGVKTSPLQAPHSRRHPGNHLSPGRHGEPCAAPLADIEDRGIDAADFWNECYFLRPPHNDEETRETNPVDLLTTGIFASDHVNSVSPTFLSEVVDGKHSFVPSHINHELWQKCQSGNASGILNAPDISFCPSRDQHLAVHYTAETHIEGKAKNKAELQERLGLIQDPSAPVLLWPSRLDPVQKGPELLSEILFQLTQEHPTLQVAIIANGEFKKHFVEIAEMHSIQNRVAIADFSEPLSRLGFAGSDFMIMPSRFEPCGLPQMVSPKYGTLPIAHDTGGIHDTVAPFNDDLDSGNGFLFQHYTPDGLHWAISEALHFYRQSTEAKAHHITRIMNEASERFNHANTAKEYINLYEEILGCAVTA